MITQARGFGSTHLVARTDGGNGGGGSGTINVPDPTGVIVTPHPGNPCHAASVDTKAMRLALKSGTINQGYSQCDVDRLQLMVESGQCSIDRIQCRTAAPLRATAIPAGGAVTFTVRPVGPAFMRELIVVSATPDDIAAPDFVPVFTQFASSGRVAYAGNVSSTGTGNITQGAPALAFGADFQNYVVPTGVLFDSSNPLEVILQNQGANPGSVVAMMTYDVIRAG